MSLPFYDNIGTNPSTTLNQAALGNQMGAYGQSAAGNYGLQGGLGTYLGDSIGSYLLGVITSGDWGNIAGAFGDKGAIYANGTGSLTGFDSGLGAVAGAAGGLLDRGASHQRTGGKYGHIASSADTVANVVGSLGNYNPLATGLGRLGMGAINNITGGTDGMTVQDSLLGSSAIQGTLTGIAAATGPIGWGVAGAYALASGINSATGKTTTDNAYKSFMDQDKLADVSSGYTDMDLENEAKQLYNKKYGGFSRGAYKKAQRKVDEAQMRMTDKIDIRDTARLGQIRAGMVDANNTRYKMSINGGYKPLAVGKHGLKVNDLEETKNLIKRINQRKRNAMFTNIIPAEAREAMRDVTKVPNDALPFFLSGGTMNVIPEGSLHARLHHMENSEHITKKGIPVVDNEGRQLAEIERNEIIFRKEVTNKLEELAKDGSDEAAIEAGRLLTKEIFENTDDRTGLIQEVVGKVPIGLDGMKIGVAEWEFLKKMNETPTNIRYDNSKELEKVASNVINPNLGNSILNEGIKAYQNEKDKKLKEKEMLDYFNYLTQKVNEKLSDLFAKQNISLMNSEAVKVDPNGNIIDLNRGIDEFDNPESNMKKRARLELLKKSISSEPKNSFALELTESLAKSFDPSKLTAVQSAQEGGVLDEEAQIRRDSEFPKTVEEYIENQRLNIIRNAIQKAVTREKGYPINMNCIATALNNYGWDVPCFSNVIFAKDPGKWGFEQVEFDDVRQLPDGALIQDYNVEGEPNRPGHMIMLVGRTEKDEPLYSYSSGLNTEEAMHNATTMYPQNGRKWTGFRFIGTKEQNEKWKKEFHEQLAKHQVKDSEKVSNLAPTNPDALKLDLRGLLETLKNIRK